MLSKDPLPKVEVQLNGSQIQRTQLHFISYLDQHPRRNVANIGKAEVWRSFLALFKLMNDDQSVVEKIISTVGGGRDCSSKAKTLWFLTMLII